MYVSVRDKVSICKHSICETPETQGNPLARNGPFEWAWDLWDTDLEFSKNGGTPIRAPCLSHIRREKSHHPHGTAAIQKVTSGSGKSHQGRRITMAQPASSIIRDLVKSSRSIVHSDDFEGHKLVQTNSRQLILLDLNILYSCPASRDQIKPLLVQPQTSCNANGLAVANPIGNLG